MLPFEKLANDLKSAGLSAITDQIDRSFLEYSENEDPKPMDTIGNLVDKLSIVNNKMFWNQELLYQTRRESPEAFEAKWCNDLAGLHGVLKRCLDLNTQRARLMDEIDQKLVSALKGDTPPNDLLAPQSKTY
jgi:hypothetical protein